MDPNSASETARALSDALAPVFLISAVGVLLGTMANRYGRIIDRTRQLLRDGDRLYKKDMTTEHLTFELMALYKRARLLRTTIIIASTSIFFVSVTVFLIFGDIMFKLKVPYAPETFFGLSMFCLIAAVSLFIRDFAISLKLLKHDLQARAPASFPSDLLDQEGNDGRQERA